MAYDEELAARIRNRLDDPLGVSEKKMFGGVAFMVYGNMSVGIVGRVLMVRLGQAEYEKALKEPFVRPMDFTGKPLKGFVYVDPEGIETDKQLDGWLDRAQAFVSTLPPKEEKPRAEKKKAALPKKAAKKAAASLRKRM